MAFHNDPYRPRVSIPQSSRRPPTWQYDQANPSDQQRAPYAFEVTPPPYTTSELPRLDNPWPYQPATPDTSMARVRSMVDLSGRSQSFTPTTNGHLAFPEPQLSRSVSHSQTQQFSAASSHRTSSNSTSPTLLGLNRQVSTSSFQSTTSSYWENTPEVRFRLRNIQICLLSLKTFILA